jgi:hypothetical protein
MPAQQLTTGAHADLCVTCTMVLCCAVKHCAMVTCLPASSSVQFTALDLLHGTTSEQQDLPVVAQHGRLKKSLAVLHGTNSAQQHLPVVA